MKRKDTEMQCNGCSNIYKYLVLVAENTILTLQSYGHAYDSNLKLERDRKKLFGDCNLVMKKIMK